MEMDRLLLPTVGGINNSAIFNVYCRICTCIFLSYETITPKKKLNLSLDVAPSTESPDDLGK